MILARPNILLITSDQQHYNTLGAFNKEIKTPNLDRLVREGTTFTRAYCPNPTCTPTRASIITGKYPSQHGAWTLGTKLPETEHTVGEDFSKEGYRTALIGKAHFQPLRSTEEYSSLESHENLWDLDFWRNFSGPFYGFEHCELFRGHTASPEVGQHYAVWLAERCSNWKDYFREPAGNMGKGYRHHWAIPEEYHYSTWVAERTNAMLEQYKENNESFFMWASFSDPHPSYFAPEPWDTMYNPDELTIPQLVEGEHDKNPPHFKLTQEDKPDISDYQETGYCIHFKSHLQDREELKKDVAVYYGMISLMDKYIGKILDKLDSLGLAENTMVVFTTDHGHFFGHHGLIAKGPYHYEDMIKVPFIVRCPGKIAAGVTSDAMQSLVDLAPTFLNLAGLPIPRTMAGVDQSSVWIGAKEKIRDHIICENHQEPTKAHLKTYVDERYKITVYYNRECGELFDLKEDPGEINNLWDNPAYKDLKTELLLKYIWAELGKEPMWMPRIFIA